MLARLHRAFLLPVIAASSLSAAIDWIPESGWKEEGKVLSLGNSSAWDNKLMQPAGIEKINGVFYLYYLSGFKGCWTVDDAAGHKSLGLATSSDGRNFTKHTSNPVLKPHDFVPVGSQEEGIRRGVVRYVPTKNRFEGYFGVESPGGSQTCSFMGTTGCGCNIEVDSYIFAAASPDGKQWSVLGEVSGVNNARGNENYVRTWWYASGNYYIWTSKAQGLDGAHVGKGADIQQISDIGITTTDRLRCTSFLHNDNKTVTLLWSDNKDTTMTFFTVDLSNPLVRTNERKVGTTGMGMFAYILKDTTAKTWFWYHEKLVAAGATEIFLRTHPLEESTTLTQTGPGGLKPEISHRLHRQDLVYSIMGRPIGHGGQKKPGVYVRKSVGGVGKVIVMQEKMGR
jgi:hypothetical protein